MSSQSAAINRRHKPSVRVLVGWAAVVIVLVAMALDTKMVKISAAGVNAGVFSPAKYGETEFPKVQAAIESRAVDAATLAAAIIKDPAAAAKQYGVVVGAFPEFSVKFKGVVGKENSGVYFVKAEGVPDSLVIRVQTGPAINGTDLRDAAGSISFGQFVNQIDYQNAGSALNKEMKKLVLSKIDASKLSGKTISVVGAFRLINPKGWFVTPVKLDVQ